jgi:hypothetical protein
MAKRHGVKWVFKTLTMGDSLRSNDAHLSRERIIFSCAIHATGYRRYEFTIERAKWKRLVHRPHLNDHCDAIVFHESRP